MLYQITGKRPMEYRLSNLKIIFSTNGMYRFKEETGNSW